MEWQFLCAADLFPIPSGEEGIVVRGGSSVYVHNEEGCRRSARPYPANLDKYKKTFDRDGNKIRQ